MRANKFMTWTAYMRLVGGKGGGDSTIPRSRMPYEHETAVLSPWGPALDLLEETHS